MHYCSLILKGARDAYKERPVVRDLEQNISLQPVSWIGYNAKMTIQVISLGFQYCKVVAVFLENKFKDARFELFCCNEELSFDLYILLA